MSDHIEGVPASLAAALHDRYSLTRVIGRGGMATVYLAEDVKHGRSVAVKVLNPELSAAIGQERFSREIEIAARLSHPHILTLIDSGEEDGYLYYVMPFVDGESLGERLRREGSLTVSEATGIIGKVASALAHAHERGVVHRDVKPGNILLSGDQAVVADFGIARAVQVAGGSKLTGTGIAVGTPAYMSPEQAFDTGSVDHRTDIYAMGCVLFEMITGRTPYESDTAMALLAKHAAQRAPSLRQFAPGVPLFVDRAVAQALAKAPEDRFASAKAFADTLANKALVDRVGRRRIAVLPPVNIGGDAERQHLVLALHEALISKLGAGDLAVLARTSVLQYADHDRAAREVCRQLAVDAVVESSVFCVGEDLAIEARLVDGASEETLWSGSYEGEIGKVMSLYRNATRSMAEQIHGVFEVRAAGEGERRAVDPLAYEKYMRGRVHQQSFNPADIVRAQQYYEAALEIDPDYAPAYAGLSLIYGSMAVLGIIPASEYGAQWLSYAEKAVELDPTHAEGYQALAQARTWYDWDWPAAEDAFRSAIELDPNEPQARIFYSHLLAMLQRRPESDEQMTQAMESDPYNPFAQMLRGIQLGLVGNCEQGIEQLSVVPPNPLRSFALSWQNMILGDMEEGVRRYQEYFQLLGDQETTAAMAHDDGDLRGALLRGAEVLARRSETTFVKPNNIVHLYAWGGDLDRAIEWMERSFDVRDHELVYMGCMGTNPDLKGDPRYLEIMDRLGLPVGYHGPT